MTPGVGGSSREPRSLGVDPGGVATDAALGGPESLTAEPARHPPGAWGESSVTPTNTSFLTLSEGAVAVVCHPFFNFNISPSNEYPGLISFRMDLLDPDSAFQSHSHWILYS